MKKSELNLHAPVFVAINSTRGTWASANTLERARKDAQCRKKDRVMQYRVDNIDQHPLTKADLDPQRNGGLSYEGYKPGDLLHPWVNNHGGLVYNGDLVRVGVLPSGVEYEIHGKRYGDTWVCSITWLPHGEVGSITIPLHRDCADMVHRALLFHGRLTEAERKSYFAT